MVEDIKALSLKPQLHTLAQGEPFCQVEVAPKEIRTTQGIAAEGSELAGLRAVAAIALPCARIDGRYKGVGIQPLQRARLCDTRNRMMIVQRDSGNDTGELRSAPLHDSVSVCGIGRAQDRERNSGVPKGRSRNLPAVERVAQRVMVHSYRQLIHILRVEILPDVIVAGTIITS